MKLAILGGSFNPVHIGHITLAETVYKELAYDKIAVVPAFISPFKAELKSLDAQDRLNMINLAIKDYPYMYCETYEIEKEGISYTAKTISYLYKKFSVRNSNEFKEKIEGKIGLIIGEDLAATLPAWKNAEKIINSTDIIIGRREVLSGIKKDLKNLPFFYKELKNKLQPVSSTEIRFAILNKKEFKHFLPESVYEYIITKGLYSH